MAVFVGTFGIVVTSLIVATADVIGVIGSSNMRLVAGWWERSRRHAGVMVVALAASAGIPAVALWFSRLGQWGVLPPAMVAVVGHGLRGRGYRAASCSTGAPPAPGRRRFRRFRRSTHRVARHDRVRGLGGPGGGCGHTLAGMIRRKREISEARPWVVSYFRMMSYPGIGCRT